MRKLSIVLALLALAVPTGLWANEEGASRLLRYPDVHEDRIVFVYAGDLWWAGTDGGEARRLTAHAGQELSPKFSPDGRWIAYSAEYGGTRQVYVIPADGGEPRQLTYYNDVGPLPPRGGFDYRVLGWTPDGDNVLFLANRLPWGPRRSRPYLVPVKGGMETPLPIIESSTGSLSPDGKRFAFTPTGREFRTWKRYQGGQSQDVWIFDLEAVEAVRLTTFPGSDHQPMWVGDTIYFTSDRSANGKLNLFAVPASETEAESDAIRQVTDHDDYDVLWPSAGPRRIVYQSGGRIHLFDPATGASRPVPITVRGDFVERLPTMISVTDHIASADVSPSGKRAVFEARGELFTVPASEGQVRNLTRSPGVREMAPTWSPDGSRIAYLSDRSGEYEIYTRPQDGSGEETRLTTDGTIWRFAPVWSPDGKKLAFGDKRQTLWVLDVESGELTEVDRGTQQDITTYVWAPDSAWLAYVKGTESGLTSIWAHSLDEGKGWRLTSERTSEFSPAFDPEGRFLYFLSNRDYNLAFSSYEFNYLYENATRVYAALLTSDGPALYRPGSDEEPVAAEGAEEKGDGDEGESDDDSFRIEVEGFESRVVALPARPGNYGGLSANSKGPLYLQFGNGAPPSLKHFDLESEEESTLLEGVSGYVLSSKGDKMLYTARGDYGIVDVRPGVKAGDGGLDLSALRVKTDPVADWTQLFDDAWRILRDWFYDPGMHGLDWPGVRDKYRAMIPHVAQRADLDFLLGEMAGELEAGHIYVQPGDQPAVERHAGGLLGAEIESHGSGAFRIGRILPGENWDASRRSPLTEPGVDVDEGDFILAVDGRSTRGVANFYELMEGVGDRVVTLTVNDRPVEDGAQEVRVRPITSETSLRYLDWIEGRKRQADEASGGRIGYIHLPDTAVAGNRELNKGFLYQTRKDALIFDARYNGGGFIPDRMIEIVNRPLLNYWSVRGVELGPTPGLVHVGPKAALVNGYSGSGGDAFPYYFRKLGLGPLIGTTTWGGLIGISFTPSLADGGSVTAASFRFVDTDGNWAVEGVGVDPDIEVVDRPDALARGEDPSLEKAIEVLLEELEKNPPKRLIESPEPPDHGG